MTSGVNYSIRIKQSAAKELARLSKPVRGRIIKSIDALGEQPFKGTALKGELTGLRRIRIGDYRVVYEIAERELTVLVVRVSHRRDVYR